MTDSSTQTPERASPAARSVFPLWLLTAYLLLQLLVIAWSAFPERTMKSEQPLESWSYLAGCQAMFLAWLWPLVRMEGAGRWRRASVDAVLLAAAAVPMAVPAIWWVDASRGQVTAAGCHLLGWLLAGWIVTGWGGRGLRWAYAWLMTLATWGLPGLGYLAEDLFNADPGALRRFSPMWQASHLAEAGWPDSPAAWLAVALPGGIAMLALVVSLVAGPRGEGARGRGAT